MPFSISGTTGIVSTPTLNANNIVVGNDIDVAGNITGDVYSDTIQTTSLTANNNIRLQNRPYPPVTKTIGLQFKSFVSPVTTSWSYTYTNTGGDVEVIAYISGYVQSAGTGLREYYLQRDGVTVVTGKFFINFASTHRNFPPLVFIDSAKDFQPHTYRINVDSSINLDLNDFCTMVFTEY